MLYEIEDGHKEAIEAWLETLSVLDQPVVAYMMVAMQEDGNCFTSLTSKNFNQLLVLKGFVELAVINQYNKLHSANDEDINCEEDEDDN